MREKKTGHQHNHRTNADPSIGWVHGGIQRLRHSIGRGGSGGRRGEEALMEPVGVWRGATNVCPSTTTWTGPLYCTLQSNLVDTVARAMASLCSNHSSWCWYINCFRPINLCAPALTVSAVHDQLFSLGVCPSVSGCAEWTGAPLWHATLSHHWCAALFYGALYQHLVIPTAREWERVPCSPSTPPPLTPGPLTLVVEERGKLRGGGLLTRRLSRAGSTTISQPPSS